MIPRWCKQVCGSRKKLYVVCCGGQECDLTFTDSMGHACGGNGFASLKAAQHRMADIPIHEREDYSIQVYSFECELGLDGNPYKEKEESEEL